MKLNYFIFLSIFILQNCYTVVDQTKFKSDYFNSKTVFPPNSIIDNNLNGIWINPVKWMDYGNQLRKLEIFYDGRFVYTPSSEKYNSKYYQGECRTISDTLIFSFETIDHSEKMRFNILNDTLYISSFSENENTSNNLINDCAGCRKAWYKVH